MSDKKPSSYAKIFIFIAVLIAVAFYISHRLKQEKPQAPSLTEQQITSDSVATFPVPARIPAGTKLAADQTLNVGVGSEIPTLDPQKISDNVSARVAMDLYETLATEDEAGNIVPGVASSWEISPDGVTYTFHIRPEAKFSDGSAITADDAVFSIRRLVDPKVGSIYSDLIHMIVNAKEIVNGKAKLESLGIKALDPRTVQITLVKPTPYFIKIVANIDLGILKKDNVLKFRDAFTQPGNLVSSGAYMLKYWKVGDKVTSVRNPNYWNNKETVVNTVNYFPITDVNSEVQMYQSGQIYFTFDIPSDRFKALKKGEVSGITPDEIHAQPYLANYYIDFNNRVPPFKDNPKLRQALSMAVDRDVLTRDVTGRGELPAYDIVAYGTSDYTQQTYPWAQYGQAQRLAEAKKLYKEAGYSAENPLKITYSYNTNALHKKVAIALASMWEKNLGVKVSLTNMEWKVFLTERQGARYETARDGWVADYNDPATFLDLMKSTNPQNNSKYVNPKYDELLTEASNQMDPQKRRELLQQASLLSMNDYPVASLYNYITTHLVKPFIGGYSGKNALDHQYSKNFYIIAH